MFCRPAHGNCVNVTPLETELSLFSFKNMKKQESFRYHMISAFLAMVEMVHVLHAVWNALLPFALLWWNVMLCATCAKYYSWNRFRFRLQIVRRRQLHGAVVEDANAVETRESLHQSKDASQVAVITDYPSVSPALALCTPMVEVGSCYFEQSLTFSENCSMHQKELLTLNPHVDNIATSTDGQQDHQFEDLSSCEEALVVFKAHASKALDKASALPTSKLSSIHVFDIRERQQFGLLTAAYWAACPFLLPQQVAPLAVYDPSSCPQKLLECLWMHSSTCTNRDWLKGKTLIQLLYTVSLNCSTVEECFHVINGGFALLFARRIGGKEYTRMARILKKLLESRACNEVSTMLQVALLFRQIVNCMKSTPSLEALESTTDDLNFKIEEHPSTSILSNSDSECTSGYCHDNYAEDASDDIKTLFSTVDRFYDSMLASGSSLNLNCSMEGGHTLPAYCQNENVIIDSGEDMGLFHENKLVFGSQSSLDSIADMEPGDAVPAYHRYEDRMVDNAEDVEFFYQEYVTQSDNYCDLYDASTNLDFRYGGLQLLQEVDSVYDGYGRYSSAADGVCSDDNYDDDGLEVDNAICGDSRFDEDWIIDESSKVKPLQQLDTWWDEDAVLLARQEHEEDDALEQAWQLV